MSDGVQIDLSGLNGLFSKALELGARGARVQNAALKAGAQIIQEEASKRAPIRGETAKKPDGSDSDSEQHLADNIIVSSVKSKDGAKYVQVGPTKGDNSRFFYGKFLEWGTSKMAARPFLGPAVTAKREDAINAIAEELKRGLGL